MTSNNHQNKTKSLAQLKWACRRGMLELDVILNRFLSEAYDNLTAADQALFVDLLSESDPELFDWLLGADTPTDPDFARMTEIIRQHVRKGV